MVKDAHDRDRTIGTAIRQARFTCGLTQEALAEQLSITRAAVASYETGRRKILAETQMDIAHICGKPLSFFDPDGCGTTTTPPLAAPKDAAIQVIIQALEAHPTVLPRIMAFMETVLAQQLADDTV